MKISVSSYSFSEYMRHTGATYTDICDLAVRLGFEGIEFTDLSTEVQPAEDVAELASQLGEFCSDINLPVVAYTVWADFLNHDPEQELERLKEYVDTAVLLKAPVLRHDVTWTREGDWKTAIDYAAPYIRRLAEYAAERGVKTCTENHGFFIQDSDRVRYLLETVNHPNYGWLVDIGNFACVDEDSLSAVRRAAPYAVHVHVKDFLIKSGATVAPSGSKWFSSRGGRYIRGTTAGDGAIPIPQCLEVLRKAGYDGWVSYEFEGAEDTLTALKNGLHYIQDCL